ncbi:unnamed protein product [Cylicostephanus goldi]|uniref:protein-tyrosine-phosphatase n=1 Tax=Cylicostephanus goldi TaxID=71465 RepID=A0A3P6UD43_CYLGO|nr:unnamed protein product [Cylicostephanus goldi]
MPDGQKYICTQGPLLECVGDFWHMILTERSKVIVMLCNFNEEYLSGLNNRQDARLPDYESRLIFFGLGIIRVFPMLRLVTSRPIFSRRCLMRSYAEIINSNPLKWIRHASLALA